MPRMHVVTTTINLPTFLNSYRENLDAFGHTRDVKFWVVGDLRTPPEANDAVANQVRRGLNAEYLSPEAQRRWLADFPDLAAIIPWNSDNRRNVGFLRALQEHCEVLFSVDDDNYCTPTSDFYAGHADTGRSLRMAIATSDNGWYNLCSQLTMEPDVPVVPRGFPHAERYGRISFLGEGGIRLAATAGLWLGDPDVDAATRLACPVRAVSHKGSPVALALGTWSPINTQNTSIARRAIPAYYYVRMLERFSDLLLDRYGDIWSGYFLQCCATHLGESVAVGQPIVDHRRNRHDLLTDLRAELWGMILTPRLVSMLRSVNLSGVDYSEVVTSLSRALESFAQPLEANVGLVGVADYLRRIGASLRIWVDVCSAVGGHALEMN